MSAPFYLGDPRYLTQVDPMLAELRAGREQEALTWAFGVSALAADAGIRRWREIVALNHCMTAARDPDPCYIDIRKRAIAYCSVAWAVCRVANPAGVAKADPGAAAAHLDAAHVYKTAENFDCLLVRYRKKLEQRVSNDNILATLDMNSKNKAARIADIQIPDGQIFNSHLASVYYKHSVIKAFYDAILDGYRFAA